MGNYKYKTTPTEYKQFKNASKHGGELLHKIFMNETGKGIAYQQFLSYLSSWLRKTHQTDTRTGVGKINDYLRKNLA
jgi:hypothetical protein